TFDWPTRRRSSSACTISVLTSMPAGQPSSTTPSAGPWDSPQVVILKRRPKLLFIWSLAPGSGQLAALQRSPVDAIVVRPRAPKARRLVERPADMIALLGAQRHPPRPECLHPCDGIDQQLAPQPTTLHVRVDGDPVE